MLSCDSAPTTGAVEDSSDNEGRPSKDGTIHGSRQISWWYYTLDSSWTPRTVKLDYLYTTDARSLPRAPFDSVGVSKGNVFETFDQQGRQDHV